MKNKMKFGALLFALALSGSLLTGCSVDLHGPHITPSGGGGGQGGGGQVTPTGDKYFVTYDNHEDYTVAGLDASGYLKGATVSFTVTPTHPEDKEVRQVLARAGTTDVAITKNGSNFSFTMPEKDVKLSIAMKNVDKYSLSYSGTLQIDEELQMELTLGSNPFAGIFAVEGKTDADQAKITVNGVKVYLKEAGDVTVVAKVDGQVVAEVSFTVANVVIVSIHDALETAIQTAKWNGSTGAGSAKADALTIAGKVIAYSNPVDQGNQNILIDDGTDAVILMVGKDNSSADSLVEVGEVIRVNTCLMNYYGMLEGISGEAKTKNTGDYLKAADLKRISRDYTPKLSTPEDMTAAQYKTYYDECAANGNTSNENRSYSVVKYVNIAVTYSKSRADADKGPFDIDGTYGIDPDMSAMEYDEVDGHKSTLTGYLIGINSSKSKSNMMLVAQTPLAVTAVHITKESADPLNVYKNNPVQLEYTTDPAGSYGAEQWSSDHEEFVKVSNKGEVEFVAEGTATITLTIGQVSDTISVYANPLEVHATSVSIVEPTLTMTYPGATAQLTAEVAPSNVTDGRVWDSSNKAVATVDKKGVVTTTGVGETTISLTVGELHDECVVTVSNQTIASLGTSKLGDPVDTYGYFVGQYDDGVTGKEGSNFLGGTQYGYWLADGASGLFVNAKAPEGAEAGKIIHVVGQIDVYSGARQVSATSAEVVNSHEGLVAASKLTVDEAKISGFTQEDQGKLAVATGVVKSVNTTPKWGTNNLTYKLTIGSKDLTIYVHKTNVSKANYEDFTSKMVVGRTTTVEGYVTANKYQSTEVSTTASEYQLVNPKVTDFVTVPVTAVTLDKTTATVFAGQTLQLNAGTEPAGSTGTFNWTVTGNSKVDVDENGLVTVAADASTSETATVTATLKDNTSLSKSCVITVLPPFSGKIDTITHSLPGVTGTSYTNWSGKSVSGGSTAVYAGNSAFRSSDSAIQIRSNNSNSGIVSTTSGGTVAYVLIEISYSQNGVDIYASKTAYTAASDLYSDSTKGTLIQGEIKGDTVSLLVPVSVTETYQYIGIRSHSGTSYVKSITIYWSTNS